MSTHACTIYKIVLDITRQKGYKNWLFREWKMIASVGHMPLTSVRNPNMRHLQWIYKNLQCWLNIKCLIIVAFSSRRWRCVSSIRPLISPPFSDSWYTTINQTVHPTMYPRRRSKKLSCEGGLSCFWCRLHSGAKCVFLPCFTSPCACFSLFRLKVERLMWTSARRIHLEPYHECTCPFEPQCIYYNVSNF